MTKNILAFIILISAQSSFGLSRTELSQILAQEIEIVTQSQSEINFRPQRVSAPKTVKLNDQSAGFETEEELPIIALDEVQ